MKKILILCLSLFAIALVPQSVSAQTESKPKAAKQEVRSKVKGDVVPIRTAEDHKAHKAAAAKTNGKQTATTPVVKEANKIDKTKEKKEKAPIQMRIRPLKGAEKAPKTTVPAKKTNQ